MMVGLNCEQPRFTAVAEALLGVLGLTDGGIEILGSNPGWIPYISQLPIHKSFNGILAPFVCCAHVQSTRTEPLAILTLEHPEV